jgi:hypothetical protein
MPWQARDRYPWLGMRTLSEFSEGGIPRAVADAMAMKTVSRRSSRTRTWSMAERLPERSGLRHGGVIRQC